MTTEDYLYQKILDISELTYQKTKSMKLHDHDKEYPKFWCSKKAGYKYFDKTKAYVLFLDGKDVTKNHHKYNLTDPKGYTYKLHQAAVEVMTQYEINCTILTGIDETSIIFNNVSQLSSVIKESDCIDNTMQIIEQKIVKLMYKEGIDTEIRGSMFAINVEDVDQYMTYREKIIYDLGLVYYAKDNMTPDKYHNLSNEKILNNIKEAHLYDDFMDKMFLRKGYHTSLNFPPICWDDLL